MAEIRVQRKRKNLGWLWLLLILIVLAAVYYLYTNNYFTQDNVNVMYPVPAGNFVFEGISLLS